MPDIKFDDFIEGLRHALAAARACLQAKKQAYLMQQQETCKYGDMDGFDVYLGEDINKENSIKSQTIHIPFLSLRSIRSMHLREFTLEIPVTVEVVEHKKATKDQRLCFVLQTENKDYDLKTHPLKMTWKADLDNILDIKFKEKSIFKFKDFLETT